MWEGFQAIAACTLLIIVILRGIHWLLDKAEGLRRDSDEPR